MKVAFVGGGNMASALIGGMLDAGFSAVDIDVLEIDAERRTLLADHHRVNVRSEAGRWLRQADVIVLAVKPQHARAAIDSIKPHIGRSVVLSIAAGVRATAIAHWLGADCIVRAMPNTPALIRAGITGAAALAQVSPDQKAAAERILRAVGDVIWFDDEAMLDPVTAVSGSGPAYVFFFIEAMQQAARELGLGEDEARELVIQTFAGATQLAAESSEPVATLRERVTSKGGTTAAALASLEENNVGRAIAEALAAANARARELGDEFQR
jgi:pyrroline-5-carboxylate reductase